jgi:hypothetical protein
MARTNKLLQNCEACGGYFQGGGVYRSSAPTSPQQYQAYRTFPFSLESISVSDFFRWWSSIVLPKLFDLHSIVWTSLLKTAARSGEDLPLRAMSCARVDHALAGTPA